MKLNIKEKLGYGGFADVWQATDELDRDVAVKIIRSASVGIADALAHARALARATHPNVVAVLTLETIPDPNGGDNVVDCVVMELIDGETLAEVVKGPKLTKEMALEIGCGIVHGLSHIHAQGMAHGDLHEANVMISGDHAKIIDILYLNSLASLTTESRTQRLRRDVLGLRMILQQLIEHSELESAQAVAFNSLIRVDCSLEELEQAFVQIVSQKAGELPEGETGAGLTRQTVTSQSTSSAKPILLEFEVAPTVVPVYGNFDVVLKNPDAISSILSRLQLDLPVEISASLKDETDYKNLNLSGSQWRRDDLIEAALLNVEKRRSSLEASIADCVSLIQFNFGSMVTRTALQGCLDTLMILPDSKSGWTWIEVFRRRDSGYKYFKAHIPDEYLDSLSKREAHPRPLIGSYGFDLVDLGSDIVIAHVLPAFVRSTLAAESKPVQFNNLEWSFGES